VKQTLRKLERELRTLGTTERAEGEKAYLKSDLEFLGVDVPKLRKRAKEFRREQPELPLEDLRALVRALWDTRYHEFRSLGIALLGEYRQRLQARDMALVEELLRRANTWAHVDWLAVPIAGLCPMPPPPACPRDRPRMGDRATPCRAASRYWRRASCADARLPPSRTPPHANTRAWHQPPARKPERPRGSSLVGPYHPDRVGEHGDDQCRQRRDPTG